jgi:hypothetical protein
MVKTEYLWKTIDMTKSLISMLFLSTFGFGQSSIVWEPEIPVADGSVYGNLRPRVVLTSTNVPLVVFSKISNGSVHAARWNGSSFNTPIALLPQGESAYVASWTGPDVASKGDTVIVVYKDSDLENGRIYSLRSTDGGISFSDTIHVDSHPAGVTWLPALDLDENGNPSVIYMGHDPVWLHPRYFVTHSTDQGLTYQPEMDIAVALPDEACDCCPAEYVINGDRHALLFRNNAANIRDIYAIYSSDDGISYPVLENIDQLDWNVNSCPSTAPHGLLRDTDLITVSASKASGEYRVYLSKSTANTDLNFVSRIEMTPPVNLNGIQNYPRISGKGDSVFLVWQESEGSAMDIMCAFTTGNDLNDLLTTKHTVNANTTSSQTNPDIVYRDGTVHLVYQDAFTGDVIYRKGILGSAGLSEADESNDLTPFPNPTNNGLVELRGVNSNAELRVLDVTGKELKTTIHRENDSVLIDLSAYDEGMYFLVISGQGRTFIRTLIK